MEQKIDNGESINADIDFVLDETLSPEEQVAAALAHAKEVADKNKRLFARAKTAEEKAKAAPSPEEKKEPIITQTGTPFEEKIELIAKGYSDDEIDFIQKNGGKKALDNPFVKTAIDTIRTQKKAEDAAVETDTSKSEVERKYSDAQLRNMTAKQLEQILPKA